MQAQVTKNQTNQGLMYYVHVTGQVSTPFKDFLDVVLYIERDRKDITEVYLDPEIKKNLWHNFTWKSGVNQIIR